MAERLKKKTARVARWLLRLQLDLEKSPPPGFLSSARQESYTCLMLKASADELVGAAAAADIRRELKRDDEVKKPAPAPAAAP